MEPPLLHPMFTNPRAWLESLPPAQPCQTWWRRPGRTPTTITPLRTQCDALRAQCQELRVEVVRGYELACRVMAQVQEMRRQRIERQRRQPQDGQRELLEAAVRLEAQTEREWVADLAA